MERISPQEAKTALDAGQCCIIDVREPSEFRAERIPGSQSIPLASLKNNQAPIPSDQKIVLCCRSGMRAKEAYSALASREGISCALLDGGLLGWRKENLPIEQDKNAPISIQRQVQITAGSLVALGTALGFFLNPGFLVIPAFVGCGLVFAGLTNTCGMAALLAKLPYNR